MEKLVVVGSVYREVTDALIREVAGRHVVRLLDDRPIRNQIGDCDALILGKTIVDEALFEAAPHLRLIQQHGRGVEQVDRLAAARRGVAVARLESGYEEATAEHALALVFACARRFSRYSEQFAMRRCGEPLGMDIAGSTLGIVGLGATGLALARKADALGMGVIAIKARPDMVTPTPATLLGGPEALHELLSRSDFVSLHAPLVPSTREIMGKKAFATMKKGASLVNTSRAALVEREAMIAALDSEHLATAALDTVWSEPIGANDSLLRHPRIFVSPHVAAFTLGSTARMAKAIAENLDRLARGEPLRGLCDP